MSFDWIALLERYGVEYVTSGPNVGRGELGVRCPFCGQADPSQHLSINLEGRGWVCRRDRSHRGRSPINLVRALLGCSYEEARRLVGAPAIQSSSDLLSQVEGLLGAPPDELSLPPLREPREFKRFDAGLPSARPYARYMAGRGFFGRFLRRASAEMGLRYCARGPLGGRVVFLVSMEGRLVNWTARAISPRARLRYRALSPDPEVAARDGLPPAALPIERCLLWYDELLAGGRELLVVEGPVDALKLRSLGRQATCLFTSSPSRWQVDLLRDLAPRFERCAILLDRGAEAQALRATQELASLGFRMAWLPPGADDPGELTPSLLEEVAD